MRPAALKAVWAALPTPEMILPVCPPISVPIKPTPIAYAWPVLNQVGVCSNLTISPTLETTAPALCAVAFGIAVSNMPNPAITPPVSV